MRIAISGGVGFIGSNLAQRLKSSGHQVYVLDNLETGKTDNVKEFEIDVCVGDLRDAETVRRFVSENHIEYFFHLGALGSVPRSVQYPRSSFSTNTISTLNVLEAVREKSIPLFFTSSSSVYGKNPVMPKIEKDWLSPISPYAASKAASEMLITSYRETFRLRTAIFRLFNVYGPRQNPDGSYAAVIPRWILAAFRNEPLIVYGDGEQKRDFTFVDDVTSIMVKSLDQLLDLEHPVNLAFGKPVSLNQVLDVFKQYFGDLNINYQEKRTGDIHNSSASTKKILDLFPDYSNPTSISEGLITTIEWYKKKFKL